MPSPNPPGPANKSITRTSPVFTINLLSRKMTGNHTRLIVMGKHFITALSHLVQLRLIKGSLTKIKREMSDILFTKM